MIILHPDGTYEICPPPSPVARWLRALVRQRRARVCAENADCPEAEASGCGDPCPDKRA